MNYPAQEVRIVEPVIVSEFTKIPHSTSIKVNGVINEQDPPRYSSYFYSNYTRLLFIRKVFAILSIQLLLICGVSALFLYSLDSETDDVSSGGRTLPGHKFLLQMEYWKWICFVVIIPILGSTGILIAFTMHKTLFKLWPWNFILLALLFVAVAIPVAFIGLSIQTELLLYMEGITLTVCVSITLFTFQKHYKFNFKAQVLCILIPTLIITLILFLVFTLRDFKYFALPSIGLSVLLSIYLIIIIEMGMSPGSMQLKSDEFILSVICVYIFIPSLIISIIILIVLIFMDILANERSSDDWVNLPIRLPFYGELLIRF